MIVGTGVDIIDICRVRSLVDRYGDRFLERWFDSAEIEYCRLKARPAEHYAARLAAKEATFKALRVPGNSSLRWKDIVVEMSGDGAPSITVRGTVKDVLDRFRVTRLHLSLSHCSTHAVAMVTAEASGSI